MIEKTPQHPDFENETGNEKFYVEFGTFIRNVQHECRRDTCKIMLSHVNETSILLCNLLLVPFQHHCHVLRDTECHFILFTVIRITPCGATGRTGPTVEQCAEEHNGTDVELITPALILPNRDMPAFNLSGVQRWTAPRGEYYTLVEAYE